MTPAEQLQEWRAELVAEHAEFEADLAEARKEISTAETAYAAAVQQSTDLQRVAARGLDGTIEQQSMASVLHGRLEDARREALRSASHARAALTARIRTLQERIAGRQLAIQQIDRALAPTTGPTLRTVVQRSKPQPVDFDNITMPHEAAK